MTINNADNYPLDTLPPLLRQAVIDMHFVTKAPIPIIAASLLASASVVSSAGRLVRRFNGKIGPIALYLMLIAESGDRKTTCDNIASKVLYDFDAALLELFNVALGEYRVAHGIWNPERESVTTALKRAFGAGKDCTLLKARLAEIIAREPIEPKFRSLMAHDITPEALVQRLSTLQIAAIFADDAGAIFQSKTFNNLGILNIAWDGGRLRVDRKNQHPLVVEKPNLTLSLMTQYDVMQSFLKKKGAQARSIGLLARFLFAMPTSAQGFRPEMNLAAIRTDGLDAFNLWLAKMLNDSFTPSCELKGDPKILDFSWPARECCREYANLVEMNLQPSGKLTEIRDAASKIGENMARIAAIFHLITGDEGEISLETTEAAIAVSDWYLTQFNRLFGQPYEIPAWEQNAQMLYAMILKMAANHNCSLFRRNLIYQCSPISLRKNKAIFDSAINILIVRGLIHSWVNGKTTWIGLTQSQNVPPQFSPLTNYMPI
jgi:hypothetical protein